MGFIKEKDQEYLRGHFADNLDGEVEIVLFTEPASPIIVPGRENCETCEDTQALLEEVASLSDKIKVTVHQLSRAAEEAAAYGIDLVPAFVLRGKERGRVRFFGIPSGYEFSAFLADLVDISKGTTDLAEETRAFLAGLDREVNIKVFTTPTCPYCPAAARMAHQLAVESPHVTADVIEAMEFPDLADRYRVRGVPKIIINDSTEFVGALPESLYIEQVRAAVAPSNGESEA